MNCKFAYTFLLLIHYIFLVNFVICSSQKTNLVTSRIDITDLNILFQAKGWPKVHFPKALDAKSGSTLKITNLLKKKAHGEDFAFTGKNLNETIAKIYQLLSCKYVESIWMFGILSKHMVTSCDLFVKESDYSNCMVKFITAIRKTQSTIIYFINILKIFTPNINETIEDIISISDTIEYNFESNSKIEKDNIDNIFSVSRSNKEDTETFSISNSEEKNNTPSKNLYEIYSRPKSIITRYRTQIIDSFQSNSNINDIIKKINESNTDSFEYLHTRCIPRNKMTSDSSRFLENYSTTYQKIKDPTKTIEHFEEAIERYCKFTTKKYLEEVGLQKLIDVKPKHKN